MGLTPAQYDQLRKPLNALRVAKRQQGGKTLSYLESFDVRAHLIRMFGYGNFDVEVVEAYHVGTRDYETQGDNPKQMVEVIWYAKVRLTIHDLMCTYVESACGSASGPEYMLGEHHDNAVKTAASDAMKRCAINLGTQFGLSLYDNGSTRDVVKGTLVTPDGWEPPEKVNDEQVAALEHSLGATAVQEEGQ
jgi:recombination DNA repair RAD52 pathway protein